MLRSKPPEASSSSSSCVSYLYTPITLCSSMVVGLSERVGRLLYFSSYLSVLSDFRPSPHDLAHGVLQSRIQNLSSNFTVDDLINSSGDAVRVDGGEMVQSHSSFYSRVVGLLRRSNTKARAPKTKGGSLGLPEMGEIELQLQSIPAFVCASDHEQEVQKLYAGFLSYIFKKTIPDPELKSILESIQSKALSHSQPDLGDKIMERHWIFEYENARYSFENLLCVHGEWVKAHERISEIQSYLSKLMLQVNKANLLNASSAKAERNELYTLLSGQKATEEYVTQPYALSPKEDRLAFFGKQKEQERCSMAMGDSSCDEFIDSEMRHRRHGDSALLTDCEASFNLKKNSISRQLKSAMSKSVLEESNGQQALTTSSPVDDDEEDRIEDREGSIRSQKLIELYKYYSALLNESMVITNTFLTTEAQLLIRLREVRELGGGTRAVEEKNIACDEERVVGEAKVEIDQELVDDVMELLFQVDLLTCYTNERLLTIWKCFDKKEDKLKEIEECFRTNE